MEPPANNDLVEINGDDFLYRRLVRSHIRKDGSVSSTAFTYSNVPQPEVSVDLARLTTPQESLAREKRPGWRLGELQASVPIEMGLGVRHAPIEGNRAHSLITGMGPNDLEQCRRLAENARILDLPPT